MNGTELVLLLDRALERLAESRDELRDLDAAVGDGDLGITVSKGCEAARARLGELAEPRPAEVIRAAGAAVTNANPSTMAALIGGGLLSAARVVGDARDVSRPDGARILRAVADSIAQRGKAALGDKTILDAIVPSLEVLETSTSSDEAAAATLAAMVAAARRAVEETTPLLSRRGRASWLGERSAGHPDPGATAYLRLLEALRATWPKARATGSPATAAQERP